MSDFMKNHTKKLIKNNTISPKYYNEYNIKRGLRNENGTGVLVGLSQISNVDGYDIVDNQKVNKEGNLFYRGYNVKDLVSLLNNKKTFGFEEIIYLLIFGELPTDKELKEFKEVLASYRHLPGVFEVNTILRNPSKSIMNKLQRSILVLYSYDDAPEDNSYELLLERVLKLIAQFPTIIGYGYHAREHYFNKKSLVIHPVREDLSLAEYFLYLIREDGKFTKVESEVLDFSLLLHADHGANNSSFTTHVLASSGTDIYSILSSAVGSLKGPKHGGANLSVANMVKNIKENCNYNDEQELKKYIESILSKQSNDKTGLIYGIGHAVYTKSDPRAEILKEKAKELAIDKNALEIYKLYCNIEKYAKEIFMEKKGIEVCANVDLYSGFIYSMLDIPANLYTPIFAMSRIAGWVAHSLEQMFSDSKIIRPAYISVSKERKL